MSDMPREPLPGADETYLDDLDQPMPEGDDPVEEFDDDPGGEEGPDDQPEGEDEPAVAEQPRRRTQAQRLRERLDKQDRELAELRARQQAPTQPQYAPDPYAAQRAAAEENERLQLMSPAEASRYFYEKGQREFQQAMVRQQLQTQDLVDKQAYDSASRSSRIHQQYAARVESTLAEERRLGNLGTTRQAILNYLVGQDAIERAGRAAPAQRRAAAGRVASQQARPTGARGNGARQARQPDQDSADEALLRGITVSDL